MSKFSMHYDALMSAVAEYNSVSDYKDVFSGQTNELYRECFRILEDVNSARECNTDEWKYNLKSKEDGKLEIGIRLKEETHEIRKDKN